MEVPHAWVDTATNSIGYAAATNQLPSVLPSGESLLYPFAPGSSQSWLTLTGATNGIVEYSVTENTGSMRTADVSVMGISVPVTQSNIVIGTAPRLTGVQLLTNGLFQFSFTNTPGAAFTVLATTNLLLPFSEWTPVGSPSNISGGQYQFTTPSSSNGLPVYYGVVSP
jgi:hypothetical protein